MTAFAELVALHQDAVVRVASRIVGPDDSEDVAQDAFLRAFHRLDRFRGEGSFRGWLLQIARNSALDFLSARRRRAAMSDILDAEAGEGEEGGTRVPARELEASERRERLRSKLRLLSDAHRTVLVLRDLEGLSYDEIAQTTGSPLGSVKGRLHRARAELADLLRRNTYDWGLPREN
jgi:RNA polymerase sigma-70 factor (ECF subfamily)